MQLLGWALCALIAQFLSTAKGENSTCGNGKCRRSDKRAPAPINRGPNRNGISNAEKSFKAQSQLTECYNDGTTIAYTVRPNSDFPIVLPICPDGSELAIYNADNAAIYSTISTDCNNNSDLPLFFQAYNGFNFGFDLVILYFNVQSFDFINVSLYPPNGIAVCVLIPVGVTTTTTPSTESDFTTTTVVLDQIGTITDLLIDETTTTLSIEVTIPVTITIPTFTTPTTTTTTTTTETTQTSVIVAAETLTESFSETTTTTTTEKPTTTTSTTSVTIEITTETTSTTTSTSTDTSTTVTTSTTDIKTDVIVETVDETTTTTSETTTTTSTLTTTSTTLTTPTLTTSTTTTTTSNTTSTTSISTEVIVVQETVSQTSTTSTTSTYSTSTTTTTTKSTTTRTTSIEITTISITSTSSSISRTSTTTTSTTPSTTTSITIATVIEPITITSTSTSTTPTETTTTTTTTAYQTLKNALIDYKQKSQKKAHAATCSIKYRGIVAITDLIYPTDAAQACSSIGPGYRLLDITDDVVLKAAQDVMHDCQISWYVTLRSFFGLGSDNSLDNCLAYYDDGAETDLLYVTNSVSVTSGLCGNFDPQNANYVLCRSIPTDASTSSYGPVNPYTSYWYTEIAGETIIESITETTTTTTTTLTTTSTSSISLSITKTTSYTLEIQYE